MRDQWYKTQTLGQVLKYFIRDGPLHVGAGVPENPESVKEMEKVFWEKLKNNYVSTIAKDISNNQVIGVLVSSIEVNLLFLDSRF